MTAWTCFLFVLQLWVFGATALITKYGIPMNLSEHDIDEMLMIRQPRALPAVPRQQPTQQPGDCTDDAIILENILHGYDKFKIPGGGHVKVNVEIWVQEVSKIIEITSEFELDIYVTEMWVDPNLVFHHMNPCKYNISVDGAKVLEKIWNPSSCFVNSKDARIHRSPFSNIFLQIYSNGSVWHNYRIKLTGPCANTLRTFPIDQQRCMLYYESFTHNYGEVQMEWSSTPITILKQNITLPDYVLVEFKASSIQRLYPPGLWNELGCCVHVFTSLRLLHSPSIHSSVHKCRDVVDFFLFGSQKHAKSNNNWSQFASFSHLSIRQRRQQFTEDIRRQSNRHVNAHGCVSNVHSGLAIKIDKASSILFPTAFFIFNIWYWFFFLG
ncbi:Neur-chan-LBD domain-containing protein [Aphelenchoides bicaudatus]|nr:Neur-chan-LBD domain-containing protein [Aphelenchoides bicaudatus]